jgi:5-formyltetrahydrofolate cyclo-ligase
MSNNSKPPPPQNEIRREAKLKRQNLSADYREHASKIICNKVVRSNFFRRAESIGCYLSNEMEVDTRAIILRAQHMKKRIFAPVITETCLMKFRELSAICDAQQNRFGIMEPVSGEFFSPSQLDIVLTPGVAFDDSGNRIGMGKGYFDRTFSFLATRNEFFRPKLIGLAFECQKVEKITANPWDIRVFCTFTEQSQIADHKVARLKSES